MSSVAAPDEHSAEQVARLSARVALLEEENRWLKLQLFGRSLEKRSTEEVSPDQGHLIFNEAEAL